MQVLGQTQPELGRAGLNFSLTVGSLWGRGRGAAGLLAVRLAVRDSLRMAVLDIYMIASLPGIAHNIGYHFRDRGN